MAVSVMEMPLSGFVVSPSPPAAGNPGNHVYFEDGGWRVSPYAGREAGNIDWKGSVNGHTKVLSWLGSKGRNIPDWTDFQYGAKPQPSPYIYQNGRVFAVAPAPVLGAALTRDRQGKTWLVAIVYGDMVYRRPAKRTSSTLFDPTNPTAGWEKAGQFSPDVNFGAPDRPWFFNASGTQAQTMRLASKTLTQTVNGVVSQAQTVGLDRLYIELQDAWVVNTQNRGNLGGYRNSMQCQTTSLNQDESTSRMAATGSGERTSVALKMLNRRPSICSRSIAL